MRVLGSENSKANSWAFSLWRVYAREAESPVVAEFQAWTGDNEHRRRRLSAGDAVGHGVERRGSAELRRPGRRNFSRGRPEGGGCDRSGFQWVGREKPA